MLENLSSDTVLCPGNSVLSKVILAFLGESGYLIFAFGQEDNIGQNADVQTNTFTLSSSCWNNLGNIRP